MPNDNTRKYPETLTGLYRTPSGNGARSGKITQELADKMCDAIQRSVGGKISIKNVSDKVKQERGDKFPDLFLEAVTAEQLAEEKRYLEQRSQETI